MNRLKRTIARSTAALLTVVILASSFAGSASAAQITGRSVVIGSSAASATTSYTFTFTVPTTGTAIQSAEFIACTTASGTCTTPSGFSVSSATLASQPNRPWRR